MTVREKPHTPRGREQHLLARLLKRAGGTVLFEDSQGQPFDAPDVEVVLRIGETADEALRKLLVTTLYGVPDKTRAAEVLHFPRRSLYERMRRLDIPQEGEPLKALAQQLGVREAGDELDVETRQLVRLQRELGIPMEEEAQRANCWIAPGFDAIELVTSLVQDVRGRGGRIDQAKLYAEHLSAAAWLRYEQDPEYLAIYQDLPLDKAARRIAQCAAGARLAVIALGPGGGRREVQLVAHLLREVTVRSLYLLDLSQPLLSRALPHAEETLAGRGVRITGIQGNMYHLPRYDGMLPFEDPSVVRVLSLVGGTFGNLHNEVEFLRDALGPLAVGDLLVIDICLHPASEDPRQSRPLPQRFVDWLTLPLRQHGGAEHIDIRVERTEATVVRGSYALDFVARTDDGREFRLATLRRYDEAQLITALARVGWQHRATFPFGADYPRALLVFQKSEVQPGEQTQGGQP